MSTKHERGEGNESYGRVTVEGNSEDDRIVRTKNHQRVEVWADKTRNRKSCAGRENLKTRKRLFNFSRALSRSSNRTSCVFSSSGFHLRSECRGVTEPNRTFSSRPSPNRLRARAYECPFFRVRDTKGWDWTIDFSALTTTTFRRARRAASTPVHTQRGEERRVTPPPSTACPRPRAHDHALYAAETDYCHHRVIIVAININNAVTLCSTVMMSLL